MMRLETIEEAKKRGFTAVLTCAGPIPLDRWTPYGIGRDKRENDTVIEFSIVGYEIHESAKSGVITTGFVFGVWELL